MNDRFPDATTEDLGLGDATCIICREEMSSAKKLPCGHFFHVHCLRSWLERQQTCPTCRAPVLSPDNVPAANGTDPAAHHMHPPHQDQPAAEGQRGSSPQGQASSGQGPIQFPGIGHIPQGQQQALIQAVARAAAQYRLVYVAARPGASDW
jgi:E3 ubiquitin-protein ligase synoviolin